jgi:hypothetical protein
VNEVWVPQLGFRPEDALRMRERAVVHQGDRAIAVTSLVSSDAGTEIAFEIKDDRGQDACLAGTLDHSALYGLDVSLRDEHGNAYARSTTLLGGIGIGQHDFGFFRREIDFEPLSRDVRRVELGIAGAFGSWTISVDVAPILETDVVRKAPLDAAVTTEGVTVRLVGIALGERETLLEVESTCSSPTVVVRGIGAVMQRQKDDERLVLIDGDGRRYEEELSRETTARGGTSGARSVAKFPPLPRVASELTLRIPAVMVEEGDAAFDFTLPVTEPRDVELGRYPMVLAWAGSVDDLPSSPGQPPRKGVRIALGSRATASRRRVVRPAAVAVDGVERRCGWGYGWHPEPGFTNLTLDLDLDVTQTPVLTLLRPIVRVDGPWEIRFSRPRDTV